MDEQQDAAADLLNDLQRVKTWVAVEKARLTGGGLAPEEAAASGQDRQQPDVQRNTPSPTGLR